MDSNSLRQNQIHQMEAILAPLRAVVPSEATDVMILENGHTYVKTYKDNKIRRDIGVTLSAEDIEALGHILASLNNIHMSISNTVLETSIPTDGTRCTIVYPPQMPHASLYLRFHNRKFLSLDALRKQGMMTDKQLTVIKKLVLDRKHIFIAGGTDTGKTTLLSAILGLINPNEHLVFIEDTREIICNTVEKISPFLTNQFETNYRQGITAGTQAVHTALRMDPDRIIYGEVRDGAALELCKAFNTGHKGGMTTLHADSVEEVFSRLSDMISEVVVTPPLRTIQHAVQAVIYLDFDKSGKRKITDIVDFTSKTKRNVYGKSRKKDSI